MLGGILVTAALSCAFAEFYGYWLHKLLHSEKIEFLSRGHMVHHLVDYGPGKPLRPGPDYIVSARNRFNIFGIGMEWILPIGAAMGVVLGAMNAAGIGALYQGVFAVTGIAWGWFMFSYMHDNMHVTGFWLEKNPWLAKWFLAARRLHDIHHMSLDGHGRMNRNFGICFYFFDRLFGTLAPEHAEFDRKALDSALKRYAYIFDPA